MGRLSFLQRTAPRVLANSQVHYCLIDYSCPDHCGDWITNAFPEDIRRGRCVVEHVPGQCFFNKCAAHNAGARRAVCEGAQYVCFLDADTLVDPDLFSWLIPRLVTGQFFIAALQPNDKDVHSLTGLLVVSAADFAQSGGFDESFRGWGGEDIEMRLRLHVLHGLSFADVPLSFIRPLEHADLLRGVNYPDTDIHRSDQQNFVRIVKKLHVWRNQRQFAHSSVSRLFYHPPRVNNDTGIKQDDYNTFEATSTFSAPSSAQTGRRSR
jgi:glycosyltransferase involved in cell wall biosynthesis